MNELAEDLRELFQDEEARYAYADAALNTSVAAQIRSLRDARQMNQQELADAIGTKQSGISRLENVNYSSWNVETLRKLARAFEVRLRISFEEFGTLPTEIENFRKNLAPRKFEDDPVFNAPKKQQADAVEAAAVELTTDVDRLAVPASMVSEALPNINIPALDTTVIAQVLESFQQSCEQIQSTTAVIAAQLQEACRFEFASLPMASQGRSENGQETMTKQKRSLIRYERTKEQLYARRKPTTDTDATADAA